MFRSSAIAAALVAGLLVSGTASAGEVADFETAMRSAYADYRMALFATNAGKAEEAEKATAAFAAAWTKLTADGPPPQYADDAGFAGTVKSVAAIAGTAAGEISAGKLPKAHETLEGIREEIGALHSRNGVIGFSDRMNAYHAEMEKVIGLSDPDQTTLCGAAAVLAYLANDVASHRPADADASFDELVKGVAASIAKLQGAAEAGDMAAAKAAIGGLKQPYSKLFLKFG